LRIYRDKSFILDSANLDSFGDLTEYVNKSDIFDIGKFIETTTDANTNKEDILYQQKVQECSPKDPFNSWWSD
jgi:hypothetical protein